MKVSVVFEIGWQKTVKQTWWNLKNVMIYYLNYKEIIIQTVFVYLPEANVLETQQSSNCDFYATVVGSNEK